jgi:hypothetical protein
MAEPGYSRAQLNSYKFLRSQHLIAYFAGRGQSETIVERVWEEAPYIPCLDTFGTPLGRQSYISWKWNLSPNGNGRPTRRGRELAQICLQLSWCNCLEQTRRPDGDPHPWRSSVTAWTGGRFQFYREAVFTTAIILIDVSYSLGNVCSGTVV